MPKLGLGRISKHLRQMSGVVKRFWPPGQLVASNHMGQFSMATLTWCSSAKATMGGQISRNSSRFSSTVLWVARPTKVVTMPTPSFSLARMTFFRWAILAARFSRSSSMVLG